MDRPFVPGGFVVPLAYTAGGFIIKKLTPEYTAIDYAAVMSGRGHIRKLLEHEDPGEWPRAELTLEEDREDLVMHEREFDLRIAFAYTVLSLDEQACLGCIYIDPSRHPDFDAEITLWTLSDRDDRGLYNVVRDWIKEWPFTRPAFPAFEIPMKEWQRALKAIQ
jgi:hypothetical protein